MWVPAKWATTLPEVACCLLAAAWIAVFALRGVWPRFSTFLLPLAGIIAWAGFQILIDSTVYRWQTWMSIIYWAGNLAAFFAALQTFRHAPLRERFLRALLWFGFVVSVVSTLQALTTDAKVFWLFPTKYTGWVVMGPFVYHNQYAAFIELILPIALFYAAVDKKQRALFILMAAVMYASVITSGSRAGFLLVTFELFWIPLLLVRKRGVSIRDFARGGALLVTMLVILVAAVGPETLAARFALKDPYSIRREFLYSSVEMVKTQPLLGFGLGNWATAYPGFALFDDGLYANQAHNDWAQFAVEGGLPLFLLLVCMAAWAIPRGLKTGWGTGCATVFIHAWFDYPVQRTAVALVFIVLLACLADEPTLPKRHQLTVVR